MLHDNIIDLSDGRGIGVAQYGHPTGYPVFLFHGTPGSRLWFPDDDDDATELGVRLIALDRPGFGLSNPKPDRTLLDWADDVAEVASHLSLTTYSVLGVSGGGAYAAACAYRKLPGLRSTALISSVMPFDDGKLPHGMALSNRLIFWLSRRIPAAANSVIRAQITRLQKHPDKFKASLRDGNAHLPDADRQQLQTDEQITAMMSLMTEAYRQGPASTPEELRLLQQPWGFEFGQIAVPTLAYHGTEDPLSPFAEAAKGLAGQPSVELHVIDGGGHFITENAELWREALLKLSTSTIKGGVSRRPITEPT